MAVKHSLHNRRRAQGGFSLLEMLLTVGVAAVFFVAVIEFGQTIARDQALRAAANYVAQVDRALDNMLSNPARFNTVYNAVRTAGGRAEISIGDLVSGAGILPATPLLSTTFPAVAPFNQVYRILLRITDNMADPNDSPSMEILVASQTMVDDEAATRIAGLLGGAGGALRDSNVASTGTVSGIYGTWAIPMSTLAGGAWHTTVSAAALAPSTNNGGYVVSYHFYDFNRLARDYLYRNDMGDPALNRMQSDLSLGGYNLLGADDVTATGTITTNEMVVQDAARISGLTNIQGNLQADGPSSMASINDTTAAGRLSSPGGQLVVGGTIDTTGAVYNNSLTTSTFAAPGSTTGYSGPVTAENGTIRNGTIDARNTAQGIYATPDAAGLRINGAATISQDLKTSTLNGANINVTTGNIGTVYLQTTGNYTQGSGSGSMTVGNRLSIGGTARTSALGTCGTGC